MTQFTKILVTHQNIAALSEALHAHYGRTKGPGAADIVAYAEAAERRLETAGVPKAARVHCGYRFQEAGPWAKAYRSAKIVTFFELRRGSTGWYVVSAGGVSVYPRTPQDDRVLLTPEAKAAVARRALAPFGDAPIRKAA